MIMELTPEQAMSILPDKETISAVRRRGVWPQSLEHFDKVSIREELGKAELLQIAGLSARRRGYGLCAVVENDQIAHILFIEADTARLKELWRSWKDGDL